MNTVLYTYQGCLGGSKKETAVCGGSKPKNFFRLVLEIKAVRMYMNRYEQSVISVPSMFLCVIPCNSPKGTKGSFATIFPWKADPIKLINTNINTPMIMLDFMVFPVIS